MSVRLSFGMSTPRIRGIRPDLRARGKAVPRRAEDAARRPGLALPLLVLGVGRADDVELTSTLDDLAMFTNPLDARSNFHRDLSRFLPRPEEGRRKCPSARPGETWHPGANSDHP